MKIATRWRLFEEEQGNNLRITAILKQIFFQIFQILICAPTLCARPVEQTTYAKYLGLIVDCHLTMNWKKHVHELSENISRGIGILSKLRHFVTDDIFTQLYYSLVYPFLAYGLDVWGNTYATTLKPIVT